MEFQNWFRDEFARNSNAFIEFFRSDFLNIMKHLEPDIQLYYITYILYNKNQLESSYIIKRHKYIERLKEILNYEIQSNNLSDSRMCWNCQHLKQNDKFTNNRVFCQLCYYTYVDKNEIPTDLNFDLQYKCNKCEEDKHINYFPFDLLCKICIDCV